MVLQISSSFFHLLPKQIRSSPHVAVGNTIFTHRGHQSQQKLTISTLSSLGERKVYKSNTQTLPQLPVVLLVQLSK